MVYNQCFTGVLSEIMETPCRIDPIFLELSDEGDVVDVGEDTEAQEPPTVADEAEAAERVKCAVVAMPLGRVTHRKYFKSYADAKYHEFVVCLLCYDQFQNGSCNMLM